MEWRALPSGAWVGAWVDVKPTMTIDAELSLENKNELNSAWVRNKTGAGGERIDIAWDWKQTLSTERNRQRWVPEFPAAFQAYGSATQIKKCEDEEMNFETGTSWVTIALDMYLQGTERAEQKRRTNPSPMRDELEQATQSTTTHRNNLPMHKPSSPILTEATTQQWLDWCHATRLLMSVLRERSTVRGLKDALDNGARKWNSGMKSQDMGDATAGVKECLLVLGNLRESTSGIADSGTGPFLFGHSGDYASAGNRSVSKWWRMAHPS